MVVFYNGMLKKMGKERPVNVAVPLKIARRIHALAIELKHRKRW